MLWTFKQDKFTTLELGRTRLHPQCRYPIQGPGSRQYDHQLDARLLPVQPIRKQAPHFRQGAVPAWIAIRIPHPASRAAAGDHHRHPLLASPFEHRQPPGGHAAPSQRLKDDAPYPARQRILQRVGLQAYRQFQQPHPRLQPSPGQHLPLWPPHHNDGVPLHPAHRPPARGLESRRVERVRLRHVACGVDLVRWSQRQLPTPNPTPATLPATPHPPPSRRRRWYGPPRW